MESMKRMNEKRFGDYLMHCLINRFAEQSRWSIRALTAELLVHTDFEFFINELLRELETKGFVTTIDNNIIEIDKNNLEKLKCLLTEVEKNDAIKGVQQ